MQNIAFTESIQRQHDGTSATQGIKNKLFLILHHTDISMIINNEHRKFNLLTTHAVLSYLKNTWCLLTVHPKRSNISRYLSVSEKVAKFVWFLGSVLLFDFSLQSRKDVHQSCEIKCANIA